MLEDPIIEEIRESRRRHAESFGNDLDKIFKDLKSRQGKSRMKVVSRKPKKHLKAAV